MHHSSQRQSIYGEEETIMADAYVNIILDDAKLNQLKEMGLDGQIKDIEGKKAVQVEMSRKDRKKLEKGFAGLAFDASNACVLPAEAEQLLWKFISDNKSLDVMKYAITKLYNPLAGRDVFGRGTGMR
jgi:hypothetical protein